MRRRTGAASAARGQQTRARGATELSGRGESISRAYDQLREAIVQGRFAPGSRVIESDIAERLGLSRTPTRSALHRLQQEGYVIGSGRAKDKRLVVAPLTQSDMRELFHIVGQLEGLAARKAAERPPAERKRIVADLRGVNAALALTGRAAKPDQRRMFVLDATFHRDCVEHGAGPRLLALHDAFKPQTNRYVRLYLSSLFNEIGTSVAEHEVIIKHIASGNAEAAQRAMDTNWRNAADRLAAVMDTQGELGSW